MIDAVSSTNVGLSAKTHITQRTIKKRRNKIALLPSSLTYIRQMSHFIAMLHTA